MFSRGGRVKKTSAPPVNTPLVARSSKASIKLSYGFADERTEFCRSASNNDHVCGRASRGRERK